VARPTVAIVGRPNVGKSTLFNRLVGRRRAIVRDTPGVTRDRIEGVCRFGGWSATVVDTGGLDPTDSGPLTGQVQRQIEAAIAAADAILFVVDVRDGLTALDQEVARVLRRAGRPTLLVANKADGPAQEALLGDLFGLGFAGVFPVSAEHGRGVAELIEALASLAPAPPDGADAAAGEAVAPIRVAIVGRPNVGKSSLVNAMVGAERVVVHAEPGTTRDAVDTPVTVDGRPYVLVDTAGLRRKGRTAEGLDTLAAVMTRRSLAECDVALVMVDGSEPLASQDARIAGYAEEAGRGIVLVVNKWDLVEASDRAPEMVRALRDLLPFLAHAPIVFTSARSGAGLDLLWRRIAEVADQYRRTVTTGELNRVLGAATERRPPAGVRGKTLRVYYATQIGSRPPTFLLFVNDPAALHSSYERYLVGALRESFGFTGVIPRLRVRRRRPARSGALP
jgi:GTP-binding protein